MKQCSVCKTTYTDATLMYCLSDGSALIDLGGNEEEETIAIGRAGGQMRVDIPHEASRPHVPPTIVTAAPKGSTTFLKVLVAILAVGFLAAVVVAVATLFIYFNRPVQTESASNVANTGKSTVSSTPTAIDENEVLREQIADLERLIIEQKKNNQAVNVPSLKQMSTTTTARVDSPGDGFLALRSLPDSEIGARILKIPHGATVAIGGCGPVVRPAKRAGRWCQASYDGRSGWVFDAFLVY